MTPEDKKPSLVIIGNGMATGRLLGELIAQDSHGYQITVFGKEPEGNYNRIMLSPLLAGETSIEEITQFPLNWYRDNGITFYSGDPVCRIDTANKRVVSESGVETDYDKLIIATGSDPFIPNLLQRPDVKGVVSFRNMADVATIQSHTKTAKNAVVIGGGLLGLEAAHGLRQQGLSVTVLQRASRLLNQQLDHTAADLLRQELTERGVKIALNSELESIATNNVGQLTEIELKTGKRISVDLLIVAAGIVPNINLAKHADIATDRGILIDEQLHTSVDDVFALGECSQFGQHTFGLVEPIWHQVEVLVNQLCGDRTALFQMSELSTKLKVSGIDLFSAGEIKGDETSHNQCLTDPANRSYRKLIFRHNRLVGAVLYGHVEDGQWYFDLIRQQTDISQIRQLLVFGQAYCKQGVTEATRTDSNDAANSKAA